LGFNKLPLPKSRGLYIDIYLELFFTNNQVIDGIWWGFYSIGGGMGKFLEKEKYRQVAFKMRQGNVSEPARGEGFYRTKYREFCLPREYAEQNLFRTIRQPIIHYFSRHQIKWHDGQDCNPSNHLCDSQVCCVNFLFPFFDQPRALAVILSAVFPGLKEMLPIEDKQFIACEWIGKENYLNERMAQKGKRTRGANFTSADAAVKFLRKDGKIQIVLIEWKYTESYPTTPLKYAPSQKDRTEIYVDLYNAPDCPLNNALIPSFDSLFFEPFYQLMRQQFLAHKMETARELNVDIVSVLHVAPRHNDDFKRVTSEDLQQLGESPTKVWEKLVKDPDRFQSVYTEELFGKFDEIEFPELHEWWKYITDRYAWVIE
jgi:hypothetical protein